MFSPISSSSRSNSTSDLSEGQENVTPASATLVRTAPSTTRNAVRQPLFLKTHRDNLQNSLIDPRNKPFLPNVIVREILSHLNTKDAISLAGTHFSALSAFCSKFAPHNRLWVKLNELIRQAHPTDLSHLKHYISEHNMQFTPAAWDKLNQPALTRLLNKPAPTLSGLMRQIQLHNFNKFLDLIVKIELSVPSAATHGLNEQQQDTLLFVRTLIKNHPDYAATLEEQRTANAAITPEEIQTLQTQLDSLKFRTFDDVIESHLVPPDVRDHALSDMHIDMLLEDVTLQNLLALQLMELPQPDWSAFTSVPAKCFESSFSGCRINLQHVTQNYIVPILNAQQGDDVSDKRDVFNNMRNSQFFLMGYDKWNKSFIHWSAAHSVEAIELALQTSANVQKNIPIVVYYPQSGDGINGEQETALINAIRRGNTKDTMNTLFKAGCTLARDCLDPSDVFRKLLNANDKLSFLHEGHNWTERVTDHSGKIKSFITEAIKEEIWPEIKRDNENLLQKFRPVTNDYKLDSDTYLAVAPFLAKEAGVVLPYHSETSGKMLSDALQRKNFGLAHGIVSNQYGKLIDDALIAYYKNRRSIPNRELTSEQIWNASADIFTLAGDIAYTSRRRESDADAAERERINRIFLDTVFSSPHHTEVTKLLIEQGKNMVRSLIKLDDTSLMKKWVDRLDDSEDCRNLKKDALALAREYRSNAFVDMLKEAGARISAGRSIKSMIKSVKH